MCFDEFARYYAVLQHMHPAAGLSADDVAWLKMLFDRFDGDKDGQARARREHSSNRAQQRPFDLCCDVVALDGSGSLPCPATLCVSSCDR